MSKSHNAVVQGFKNGKAYKGSNIFSEGNILYSYGRHFPLAVRRAGINKSYVLLNADKYSNTTSRHQSLTFSVFPDDPRVSFATVRAAVESVGAVFEWYTSPSFKLIDHVPDTFQSVWESNEGFTDFEKRVPIGAQYGQQCDVPGHVIHKWYHQVGQVLFALVKLPPQLAARFFNLARICRA